MFTEPDYRESVTQELFLFKAKLLAIIGQMNARGVENPTAAFMEKLLGVYRMLMEAWIAGDMFEIEIRRFSLGMFREDELREPAAAADEIPFSSTDLEMGSGVPGDQDMPWG